MIRFRLIHRIAVRRALAFGRHTAVTVAGIAIAVAAAIASVSLAGGLHDALTHTLVATGAHLTVTAGGARGMRSDVLFDVGAATGAVELGATAAREDRIRIRDYEALIGTIERALGEELESTSPFVATHALATHGTSELVMPIRGVEPELEDRIARLSRSMRAGSVGRLAATRFGILLGADVARGLGAVVGDRIRLVSMTGDVFNVVVVGVFDAVTAADDRMGLVNLRMGQSLARALPGDVSGVAVQLRDADVAPASAVRIERASGRAVETWREANRASLTTLGMAGGVLVVVAAIAVLLASIGLGRALIRTVWERRDEALAMSSIGMTRTAATLVAVWHGTIVAATAVAVGIVLGAIAVVLLSALPAAPIEPVIPLRATRLPMHWSTRDVLLVAIATVAGCVVASLSVARSLGRPNGAGEARGAGRLHLPIQ